MTSRVTPERLAALEEYVRRSQRHADYHDLMHYQIRHPELLDLIAQAKECEELIVKITRQQLTIARLRFALNAADKLFTKGDREGLRRILCDMNAEQHVAELQEAAQKAPTREQINAWLEEHEASVLLIDGHDDAFIGVFTRCGQPTVAAYDYDTIVEKLKRDGLTEDEAVEHIEFNIVGAWVGDQTPAIIGRMRRDEVQP